MLNGQDKGMTQQEKRDTIKLIIGTNMYVYMFDWKRRNGTTGSILLNLLEYDLYGNDRDKPKRDAIEWICKNWGEENVDNDTVAYRVKGNSVNLMYVTLPDNAFRLTKYGKMGYKEKEAATKAMNRKSNILFMLLKMAGWPIMVQKRLNTDLSSVSSRDPVGKLMDFYERFKNDEEMNLPDKKVFYFKEGSSYYMYSVSPQHWGEVQTIIQNLGIKVKVIA